MGWLEIFCLLAMVIYAAFLLGNIFISRDKEKVIPSDYLPTAKISIIIPARNEEKNIVSCLQSILEQDFSQQQMEIIVVNDHSTDNTLGVASAFLTEKFPSHKIIDLAENEYGKKTAIQKAVEQSTGSIIVTRDADTISYNKNWLKQVAFEFENNAPQLLIMPVILAGPNSFASAFQKFENLAIMLLGRGMAKNNLPIVCSGANLAYPKETFLALDPYKTNSTVASGDDMFLLKAVFQKKLKINFSNNPVYTPAESNFKKALQQRLRWVSKSGKIATLPIFMSGLALFLGNLAGLVALFFLFIDTSYLPFCLFTLAIKLIIDFLLLFLSASMFKISFNPAWYLPAFVLNLAYAPVIAILAFVVKPDWKDRKN